MSTGTVDLANSDPLADPRVNPNFFGVTGDLETMVRGFKITRSILRSSPFDRVRGRELYTARVDSDDEIRAALRQRADTVYHPVGTCKMGLDAMAVVDPRLRVHGIEGLRVVDCSVMPRIIGGNTNAPAVMIGEKASDLILEDHRS
jgi:choline dehydrogenase-like flavoprotein